MKNIFLFGVVGWEINFDQLQNEIDINSADDLRIFVDSPGGSPWEAFLIYNYLRMYKGKIEFVILGKALSAMSIIILAANKPGNSLSVFTTSVWMGHRVQMYTYGDIDAVAQEIELARDTENLLVQLYLEKFTMDEKELRALLQKEYWLIGGEKIMSAGIANKIYNSPEEMGLDGEFLEENKNINDSINVTIEMSNNLARAEFENVKNKLKDKKHSVDEQMKIAALYKEYKTENKKSIADLFKGLFNADKKTLDTGKTEPYNEKNNVEMEFLNMDLNEYLEKNPSQKTVFENMVNEKANALIQSKNIENRTEIVESEQTRIFKILEYENISLTELSAKAIDENLSVEEYKDLKIKNEADKREKKTPVKFGSLANKQTPAEQTEKVTDKVPAGGVSDDEYDADIENRVKKTFGGDK